MTLTRVNHTTQEKDVCVFFWAGDTGRWEGGLCSHKDTAVSELYSYLGGDMLLVLPV